MSSTGGKRLAIMQPYFFPYVGYFQLMSAVDEFVLYDNIQFSKKGWIQRNRILVNGQEMVISVPLKKDSDFLDIRDRTLADVAMNENQKTLRRIKSAYRRAPYFVPVFEFLSPSLLQPADNLFLFLRHTIERVREYLRIETPIIVSSTVSADHAKKGRDRVIEICRALGAGTYINPIGGVELYEKDDFERAGVTLLFHRIGDVRYPQVGSADFVPNLSIIDVMMNNSVEDIRLMLSRCECA